MVSSGTEAVMSAVRLARGFTGRDKVVKFDGGYHGHGDFLLVQAGSGLATAGIASSPGVPAGAAADTISLPYNDAEAVSALMKKEGDHVAAIIVEPVAGNMGVVPPRDGFLETLRELATKHGAVLIFDEVITGFRVARGGAQERFGVTPDLTVLGKILGGGMPVGAYGGRRDIMNHVAPVGEVYQAGTLSGNPVAMAAGLATLAELKQPGVYESLETTAAMLAQGFEEAARSAGIQATVNRVGSMMTCFIGADEVNNYADARCCNLSAFGRLHGELLTRGVYMAPSQFEAVFVSMAHTQADMEQTVTACRAALQDMAPTL
jgi:glutamate-1-semialdehyde 2,1-aminomutase